jgi:hypothetical protein
LAAIAPFGIGQYYNGSPILGTAFLVGEAGALGAGIYFYMSQQSKFDEAIAFKAAYEQNPTAYGSTTEEAETAKSNYLKAATAYIAQSKTYMMISFGSFGALWAVGIIEAFVSGPSKPAKKPSRRNSKFTMTPMPGQDELGLGLKFAGIDQSFDPDIAESGAEWSWLLAPETESGENDVLKIQTGLQLNWKF